MPATIDALEEELIYFSEAKKVLPGQPAHQTVDGWYRRGRRSLSGRVVKLEAINTPRGLATTRRAYRRFIAALNDFDVEGGATSEAPHCDPT